MGTTYGRLKKKLGKVEAIFHCVDDPEHRHFILELNMWGVGYYLNDGSGCSARFYLARWKSSHSSECQRTGRKYDLIDELTPQEVLEFAPKLDEFSRPVLEDARKCIAAGLRTGVMPGQTPRK